MKYTSNLFSFKREYAGHDRQQHESTGSVVSAHVCSFGLGCHLRIQFKSTDERTAHISSYHYLFVVSSKQYHIDGDETSRGTWGGLLEANTQRE